MHYFLIKPCYLWLPDISNTFFLLHATLRRGEGETLFPCDIILCIAKLLLDVSGIGWSLYINVSFLKLKRKKDNLKLKICKKQFIISKFYHDHSMIWKRFYGYFKYVFYFDYFIIEYYWNFIHCYGKDAFYSLLFEFDI